MGQKLTECCSIKIGFATPKECMKEQTGHVRKMTEDTMSRTFVALGRPGARKRRT